MPYQKVVLACFDESGKLNDSEVLAFGGCVALPDTMGRLTDAWERRLKSDGLPYTSMKDAMNFRGPYLSWKRTPGRRDAVIRDLGKLILETPMLRIVSPIQTSHFKTLPQEFRMKFRNDPQYAGFEACVLGILHARRDIGVHIMCDLSEQYSEKCVALFHLLRKRNLDAKDRCVGIGFADDEVNGPLQAADMISYCARAEAIRNTIPQIPWFKNLLMRSGRRAWRNGQFCIV